MYSLSKTTVPAADVQQIARHHFGSARSIRAFKELEDGLFNAAYRIELDDGLKCILKVAPSDGIRVMRYEKNIMQVVRHYDAGHTGKLFGVKDAACGMMST